MKRLLIVLICVMGVVLTGCMKEYPLTEAQTDIVAEYMASCLLKNDKKYTPTLISYEEIFDYKQIPSEEIPSEEVTEPEAEPTNIPKTNDNNEDDIHPAEEPKDMQYSLSEVIGDPSFDIQYTSYQLAETYPEDNTNLVFSIDPRVGYQLLVINFTVENITDLDQNIDLDMAEIQYQLDTNIGTVYKPSFALLENNLQYIKMNIRAGEKIPAVLIYEVPKDTDLSYINLKVSRGSKTKTIKIK
ncbi:MAG TPA: DUF4352 domain-containing protein [Clostridiales bacterium]|nr:DUF4352 domain-containing protein [Clostridiales bacterium]